MALLEGQAASDKALKGGDRLAADGCVFVADDRDTPQEHVEQPLHVHGIGRGEFTTGDGSLHHRRSERHCRRGPVREMHRPVLLIYLCSDGQQRDGGPFGQKCVGGDEHAAEFVCQRGAARDHGVVMGVRKRNRVVVRRGIQLLFGGEVMKQRGGADLRSVGELTGRDPVESVLGKRVERHLEQDPTGLVAVVQPRTSDRPGAQRAISVEYRAGVTISMRSRSSLWASAECTTFGRCSATEPASRWT